MGAAADVGLMAAQRVRVVAETPRLGFKAGTCSVAGFHRATRWLVKIDVELFIHSLLETVTWTDSLWLQSLTNEAPGIF